ncbi:hypothetical protein KUTeg_006367 [Tegillarca granosa]|uniref:C1q domain-containing protein n=1 Tax=Tegillarca granosa TaxID=220873 RepID=A0ABQ9FGB2_TEGGR|nr:hypothetical protein KUTeg_006367 [Tegillarca granosa]
MARCLTLVKADDSEQISCLLVDDNDHALLMQIKQNVDILKAELAQMKADQQTTQDQQHVAFMASLSHDLVNLAIGHRIVFDKVRLNEGNGYSNRRGTFVAPANGTYHFTLEITYPSTDPTHDHDAGI